MIPFILLMNSFNNFLGSSRNLSHSLKFYIYHLQKLPSSLIIVLNFRTYVRIAKEVIAMNYAQIAALIPFYSTNGENSTCILYQDGSKSYKTCSIKKYLQHMLYALHLDPSAVKYWTYEVIGTKLNTPIIIDDHLIFLPVKLRKGVGKQDGCFGYINNNLISSYDNNEITLCNGETLPTLSPKSYIHKKQCDAKLLSYAYVDYKKQYEFMWKPHND